MTLHKKGLLLATVLFLLGATVGGGLGGTALAKPGPKADPVGWLFVNRFIPESQLSEFKGFQRPRVFVFKADGTPHASGRSGGHWETGEYIAVPPGDYQVELGHDPVITNRWRYSVAAGKVTQVRSGLVMVPTPPQAQQPPDATCKPWRAVMVAQVYDTEGRLVPVLSNLDTEADDFGMLQLHEGTYIISFNELRTEVEILHERTLSLPTATIGPVSQPNYRLSERQESGSDNPSVVLCTSRPTQVLAGTYWGSFYAHRFEPPYRELVWERQEVQPTHAHAKYQKAPRESVRKPVLRGAGAKPTRVAEPVLPPAAPAAPADQAPAPAE